MGFVGGSVPWTALGFVNLLTPVLYMQSEINAERVTGIHPSDVYSYS